MVRHSKCQKFYTGMISGETEFTPKFVLQQIAIISAKNHPSRKLKYLSTQTCYIAFQGGI